MRIIKLGLISLSAFAIMLTFISFFFPSHVRISKAINIGAPADSVVYRLHSPSLWHPAYDSAGGLADTVLRSTAITKEETDYYFGDNNNTRTTNGWKVLSGLYPDSVTVQWYMDFRLRWYPWEKFSSLLFESRYGQQMEKGLSRLKQVAERQPSVQ